LKDNHIVIGSGGYTESEGFHKSEETKETEVQRMAVALPVQQPQDNQGPKEWHIEGPWAMMMSMYVERIIQRDTHCALIQKTAELDLESKPPTIVVAN
jgi:hypothetical protein